MPKRTPTTNQKKVDGLTRVTPGTITYGNSDGTRVERFHSYVDAIDDEVERIYGTQNVVPRTDSSGVDQRRVRAQHAAPVIRRS